MNIPKFRAWIKAKKEMHDVLLIDWLNGLVDLAYSNIELDFNDVILMQSTGLFDKNGVEIFEGDIINCGYLFSGSPFEELDDYEEEKGVVKFLNCGFNVKFKNDTNLFIDIIESCEDVEVISNIYENSELLED